MGGRGGKAREGEVQAVKEAWERYDQLVEMFEEDDIGREKAKSLKRVVAAPSPEPETQGDDDEEEDDLVVTSGQALGGGSGSSQGGSRSRSPPTNDIRPFKDDEDEEPIDHQEMLAQQQQMMDGASFSSLFTAQKLISRPG